MNAARATGETVFGLVSGERPQRHAQIQTDCSQHQRLPRAHIRTAKHQGAARRAKHEHSCYARDTARQRHNSLHAVSGFPNRCVARHFRAAVVPHSGQQRFKYPCMSLASALWRVQSSHSHLQTQQGYRQRSRCSTARTPAQLPAIARLGSHSAASSVATNKLCLGAGVT